MVVQEAELGLTCALRLIDDRIRVAAHWPVRQARKRASPAFALTSLQAFAHLLMIAESSDVRSTKERAPRSAHIIAYAIEHLAHDAAIGEALISCRGLTNSVQVQVSARLGASIA